MLDGMRLRITNGCFGHAIDKYISITYTGDTKTRDPRDLLVARWRGTLTKRLVTSLGTAAALYVIACTI
ncbi:hypothetical protein ALC62_03962 [Cyphomyrmex costatus]|uniref:Uncharacterized protein n=1 Tax=Cyphomyrmex costatus TaxID=456900 RepID=A0A195CWW6_9HYME|nr:hypothetical protein ALC62_03962 [Cyphomyrmex costatus]